MFDLSQTTIGPFLIHDLSCSCYSIFSLMCMFCRSLFVLLYFFFLAIVLSVLLRYTDSDYLLWYLQTLLKQTQTKNSDTLKGTKSKSQTNQNKNVNTSHLKAECLEKLYIISIIKTCTLLPKNGYDKPTKSTLYTYLK